MNTAAIVVSSNQIISQTQSGVGTVFIPNKIEFHVFFFWELPANMQMFTYFV